MGAVKGLDKEQAAGKKTAMLGAFASALAEVEQDDAAAANTANTAAGEGGQAQPSQPSQPAQPSREERVEAALEAANWSPGLTTAGGHRLAPLRTTPLPFALHHTPLRYNCGFRS